MGPLCGLRLGQNASLTLNNNNHSQETPLPFEDEPENICQNSDLDIPTLMQIEPLVSNPP